MSGKRQSSHGGAILVRSFGAGMPPGMRTGEHVHSWAQLVYATVGVLNVATPAGFWIAPPRRAVWIPPDVRLEATDGCRLQTLYFLPDMVRSLPRSCSSVPVAPLLRELVLETRRRKMLRKEVPADARLAAVIVDQIAAAREAPLDLRMPADPRARRVADRVREDPAADTTLATLARGSGASERTIERIFRKEMGCTFGGWRRRARLLEALKLLARDEPVTTAALAVGYDSTSAFIAMFKRTLGTTPGRWGRDPAPDPPSRASRAGRKPSSTRDGREAAPAPAMERIRARIRARRRSSCRSAASSAPHATAFCRRPRAARRLQRLVRRTPTTGLRA